MPSTKSALLLSVVLITGCALGDRDTLFEPGDFDMPDSVTIDLHGEEAVADSKGKEGKDAASEAQADAADTTAANTDEPPAVQDADSAAVLERLNQQSGGQAAENVVVRDPEQVKQAKLAQDDFNRALGEMRKGNLDTAQARFKDLAQQYPALAGPIVNQAIILRKKGKTQEAYDLLQQSILQHGKNPRLLNELGVLSRQLGKFKQAQVSYESAIRIDDRYAAAHYNLGVLADLYLHDPALALQEFEIYQSLIPEPNKQVSGWIVELQRRAARTP